MRPRLAAGMLAPLYTRVVQLALRVGAGEASIHLQGRTRIVDVLYADTYEDEKEIGA